MEQRPDEKIDPNAAQAASAESPSDGSGQTSVGGDQQGPDPFAADANGWRCASATAVCEATREAVQQVEDVAMSLVSPEVTRHLVNAQQELLRAGIRVASLASGSAEKWGQKAIDALESKAGRAEQLHAGRKRPASSNPSS